MLRQSSQVPWKALATPRTLVALSGVFTCYLTAGFLDTTLPQRLEDYLGPISMSDLSVVLSIRSACYLVWSYLLAQIMHRKLLSFERMLTLGSSACICGLALVSPWGFVNLAMLDVASAQQLFLLRWCVQIWSLIVMPLGLSAIFIPALPLMHSEVRHLGNEAVEQVARYFIVAMSLGEAIGPIIGGAAVEQFGFVVASQCFAVPLILVLLGTLITYDPEVASLRAATSPDEVEEEMAAQDSSLQPILSPKRSKYWLADIVDGDSAYAWRQLPFALSQDFGPPGSAPNVGWRRTFSPVHHRKPWSTAPSSTFRRAFRAEAGRGEGRPSPTG